MRIVREQGGRRAGGRGGDGLTHSSKAEPRICRTRCTMAPSVAERAPATRSSSRARCVAARLLRCCGESLSSDGSSRDQTASASTATAANGDGATAVGTIGAGAGATGAATAAATGFGAAATGAAGGGGGGGGGRCRRFIGLPRLAGMPGAPGRSDLSPLRLEGLLLGGRRLVRVGVRVWVGVKGWG